MTGKGGTGKAENSYLLDTVVIAAYFNGEQAIFQRLQEVIFFVSSISIGELFLGAYHSQHVVDNIRRVHEFVSLSTILPCDEVTGDYFGQVKQQLRAKGRPIPDNDIWIAATAMQHGLSLATRDKHFREIEGLSLVMW